jgi:TRAP transporter TAXI family solute receptor
MKIEDVKWQYLPYGKAADALRDRKVDMVWFHVGIPNSTAEELAHRADIRVLELDKWAADNLVKEIPFYHIGVLPKGIYRGVDRDIRAGQIITTLYCYKDQDPDFTYQLCKAFYANLDYMGTVHPSAKQIKLEEAMVGRIFPFHPGAEKYYKEVGLLK